jgi:hypothetical protein
MRNSLMIAGLLVLLTLGSGCVQFGTYMKDRGNDLADCFTVRVGISYGLGVRAQVTNYLSASVGGAVDKKKIGYFMRDSVDYDGHWIGIPVLQLVITPFVAAFTAAGGPEGRSDASTMQIIGITAYYLLSTDIRVCKTGDIPQNQSVLLVNPDFLWNDCLHYHRFTEKCFIELGATLGAVGFDIGFNPVEFADFLLGWFAIDMTGDDSMGRFEVEPEGAKKPAP